MAAPADMLLLRQYAEHRSEAAFAELVAMHIDMVYSAALRQVRDRDLAEEVAQTVFILLARKAQSIRSGTSLGAWLHKATRFTALNALKARSRRKLHEQKKAQMTSENFRVDSSWRWLSPVLDEGISLLSERDREVIILRFFEQKSIAETSAALGISADAAAMRVSRALRKLRGFFNRRGVSLTAIALAGVISANSVRAAPKGMAKSVAEAAAQAVRSGGGAALAAADQVARAIMFQKARIVSAYIAALLAAGLITTLFFNNVIAPNLTRAPIREQRMLNVDSASLNIWRSGMT